jgi:hypothetical protein
MQNEILGTIKFSGKKVILTKDRDTHDLVETFEETNSNEYKVYIKHNGIKYGLISSVEKVKKPS